MTEQLTLFNFPATETIKPIHDPYWDEIVLDEVIPDTISLSVEPRVGEQVTTDTKKSAPQHDTQNQWLEKYWVERSGSKYWYYRYMWMDGRKLHRVYIGSVNSPKAREKKSAVESAIADGQTPQEIQKLIRFWRNNNDKM
ncbi:DUF4102 domain-containing protein [Nostoc sp. CCY0012]|uniref:DUF4102 domain-containing protein n=1 Tax=Nostoc sp. CCY0012 TaxID=1056123 RepID=UPI0039C640A7